MYWTKTSTMLMEMKLFIPGLETVLTLILRWQSNFKISKETEFLEIFLSNMSCFLGCLCREEWGRIIGHVIRNIIISRQARLPGRQLLPVLSMECIRRSHADSERSIPIS